MAGGHQPGVRRDPGSADGALAHASPHRGGSRETVGNESEASGADRAGAAAGSGKERSHPAKRLGEAQRQRRAGADVASAGRRAGGRHSSQTLRLG